MVTYDLVTVTYATDLSLLVRGCEDLYRSFSQYTQTEVMEGDNRYHAEGYGLQDVKKYTKLLSLPPILNIQLRRFEYDTKKGDMIKVWNVLIIILI
jgi:ubiquitin carboxyl-terminal hydrolase 7